MSTRDEEERRARAWLGERGYACERPKWLPKGRNPDYWAQTETVDPPGIWIEVKSTDEDGGTSALGKHYPQISDAVIPPGLHGHALFHLAADTAKQSIARLLKSFALQAPRYVGKKCVLAFVQQSRDKKDLLRAEVTTEIPEMLWIFGSGGGLFHPPLGMVKDSYAITSVFDRTALVRSERAFNIFDWLGKNECALVVHLDPCDRPLEQISSMSGGTVTLREKSVAALADANNQIKTACRVRPAPGIALLVPRDRHASSLMVQAACYGQLQVPVTVAAEHSGQSAQMFHGGGGVFAEGKNRHLSAAILLTMSGDATFYPNPYAHHKILDDAQVFDGATRARVSF